MRKIDNKWFFTELPFYLKFLLMIFIKGDVLVLLPLLVVILLTGLISLKLMLILLGSYIAVRYLGEMIYWIHMQFGDRKYRPPDMGFKNLNNHALYILYQTVSVTWMMLGIGVVVYALLYI